MNSAFTEDGSKLLGTMPSGVYECSYEAVYHLLAHDQHMLPEDLFQYTLVYIRDVLATMNNNKSADCYGLCAEHYKLAGDLYCSFLALCFNAMFYMDTFQLMLLKPSFVPQLKTKMVIYLIFLTIGPLHWLLFSPRFLNMSC